MIDIEGLDPHTLIHIAQLLPELHRRALLQDKAKGSLLDFARYFYPDYRTPPHVRLLAEKLEAVERGEIRRLAISMPPRHGKSMLTSQIFPAWFIGRHPNWPIICATYADDLAQDWGRTTKGLIINPTYQHLFPGVELKIDSQAAKRFTTTQGGGAFYVGAGGVITGRGGMLFIADDLIKGYEEAQSPTQREGVKAWYRSIATTRLETDLVTGRRGSIVLVGTRWHEDDVIGFALRETEHEDWVVINLPAIAEPDDDHPDPLGRNWGEALWPEKLPLDELEKIKKSEGSRIWQALYQQSPSGGEAAIFRREWWQRWNIRDGDGRLVPPQVEYIIQAYDCAYSEKKTADFTAITTWGVFTDQKVPKAILLGAVNERVPYFELRELAKEQYKLWQPDNVLIENKAAGISLIQDLRRAGIPVSVYNTDKDKETRAWALTSLFESGRVYIPDGKPWADQLVEQAAIFPHGRFDDMIDSSMLALERLAKGYFVTAEGDEGPDDTPRSTKRGYW